MRCGVVASNYPCSPTAEDAESSMDSVETRHNLIRSFTIDVVDTSIRSGSEWLWELSSSWEWITACAPLAFNAEVGTLPQTETGTGFQSAAIYNL